MTDAPLTIARLGHRGDGVADGPIFVQRTLPGEIVTGTREGDRLAQPKILAPSADRVRAPCPHYASCGGCALQHATDTFVSDWKREVVVRALAARGLKAPFRPVLTSPPRSRRRATFALRRTKAGALVGFHGRASDNVVDAPVCHLVEPTLVAARPALVDLVQIGGSRKATLSARVTAVIGGLDVAVTGGKPLDPSQQTEAAACATGAGILRLTWDGETVAQSERPLVDLDGIRVPLPPGAFLQATRHGEACLRAAIVEAVSGARHIVDLFSGIGTFALPLAKRATVHAVEGERDMTDALLAGRNSAQGLRPVTAEARDLFRRPLEPDELARFDAAVIDPPRAGAAAQAARLAASSVPLVAAVSCDPATFARDARTLIDAGFRLDWVQVVDQFRWSPHVELAARFTRGHIAPDGQRTTP
ncbi:MAG: class I SAM-dependent RNA methyltransferase [Pseudomonadota bacterium]